MDEHAARQDAIGDDAIAKLPLVKGGDKYDLLVAVVARWVHTKSERDVMKVSTNSALAGRDTTPSSSAVLDHYVVITPAKPTQKSTFDKFYIQQQRDKPHYDNHEARADTRIHCIQRNLKFAYCIEQQDTTMQLSYAMLQVTSNITGPFEFTIATCPMGFCFALSVGRKSIGNCLPFWLGHGSCNLTLIFQHEPLHFSRYLSKWSLLAPVNSITETNLVEIIQA